MKTYNVDVYTVGTAPKPTLWKRLTLQASDSDSARKLIRAKLAEESVPPIRTISMRESTHFVVYCAHSPEVRAAAGLTEWNRPEGPKRHVS